jgi:hypothetical protein
MEKFREHFSSLQSGEAAPNHHLLLAKAIGDTGFLSQNCVLNWAFLVLGEQPIPFSFVKERAM